MAIAIPNAALRSDWRVIQTVFPFLPNLLSHFPNTFKLTRPFSEVIDGLITDEFCRNWLDLLCFLLSGLPANGTIAAEVAFMFADWYRPGVVLDYPIGGSEALVAAFVRGLTKFGGKLRLNAHVKEITISQNRATGVRLQNGEKIRARQAVISNASIWDTLKIIPEKSIDAKFRKKRQKTPQCASFMHLHLGIDATDLPSDLACHYIAVNDWKMGVTAPQNVVLISIPSILDPSLAPPGKHVIHVYTPGNEPYELWANLDRKSPEYARLKSDRAAVMWQALERVIPDIRSRCEVELVGTPLTHERFLRRDRGTYGPAIAAGKGVSPGVKTPISGLLCCGDSTFPGIGLPAVAASGTLAAHCLASSDAQMQMLREIEAIPGAN